MKFKLGILILKLLLMCQVVIGFKAKAADPKVNYDEALLTMTIDEENDPMPLLAFEEVNGEMKYKINSPNSQLIELVLENNILSISNTLDYEVEISRKFLINVEDQADNKVFVLNVNNINDNAPVLISMQCSLEEETAITLENTNCTYEISDRDGHLADVSFAVDDNFVDLFYFDYKDKPSETDLTTTVSLILKEGQTLDYETRGVYIFSVDVFDNWGTHQKSNASLVVNVIDIPDRPPVFQVIVGTKTFDEEEDQSFIVTATDGDIGIDASISYKLEKIDDLVKDHISIDDKGHVAIKKIDRDEIGGRFIFTIIAFETDDETSATPQDVVLIVNDIDDNCPKIEGKNSLRFNLHALRDGEDIDPICEYSPKEKISVNVDENYFSSIPVNIIVSDKDEGDNAYYYMTLEDASGNEFEKAFTLVPPIGYGMDVTILIQVSDPSKLDYENEKWRTISFEVVATEKNDPKKQDRLPVEIILNNINDNAPVFDETLLHYSVEETVEKDVTIATVKATDADGDEVNYGILGTNYLKIDPKTGAITTTKDNAFDFERQAEVSVQVVAKDKDDLHATVAQLIITVIDINDEKPSISVDSKPITIEENSPGVFDETTITATDADASSDLEFSVDWDSSYATKNSIRQDANIIKGAVEIKTSKPGDDNRVTATLSIIDIDPNNTPDFEKYDSIYLNVVVTDNDQKIGTVSDSARVTIGITNINDNKPEFTDNTKNSIKVVTEQSTGFITTITATDVDISDKVTYSIQTVEEATREWVEINSETGEIEAKPGIDADIPYGTGRLSFDCIVTAHDGDPTHDADLTITISITDVNNKVPIPKDATITVAVKENVETGYDITTISATDDDRDEDFHTLNYQIDRDDDTILHLFELVTGDNGATLKVNFSKPDEYFFDRDVGVDSYTVKITITDNYKNPVNEQNSVKVTVTVQLLDVNSKDPIISTLQLTAKENVKEGEVVANIQAEDKDSDEENHTFSVKINSIKDVNNPSNTNLPELVIDKTIIKSGVAPITAKKALRGYYGKYELEIKCEDTGKDPGPRTNTQKVTLEITPFNFERPTFVYPGEQDKTVFLRAEQYKNTPLNDFSGLKLHNFEVTDNQEDKWDYTFKLENTEPDTGNNLFYFDDSSGNHHQTVLLMNEDFKEEFLSINFTIKYSATIVGTQTDSSEASYSTEERLMDIKFRDMTKPHFTDDTAKFSIEENIEGSFTPDNATYGADIDPNEAPPIYYKLKEDYEFFKYDAETGKIQISKLDYEEKTSHEIIYVASSYSDFLYESNLVITVDVVNMNDELPVFDRKSYIGCILSTYETGRNIISLIATDKDGGDLSYKIDEGSMKAEGTNIDKVLENSSFDLNDNNVTLQFAVDTSMSGFFTFTVTVSDSPEPVHTDNTAVKIFIVTNDNIVKFNFQNALLKVDESKDKILSVLSNILKYDCYIEGTQAKDTEEDVYSEVRVYFLDQENQALLDGKTVYDKVSDISTYKELKTQFWDQELNLQNFDSTDTGVEDLATILKAWLIGVSAVLGVLIIALIAVIIFKTRQLNRRIANLTTHKFGSQESNLNRIGASAPTTNKNAVEGSNPIYMDENTNTYENNIDRRSVASGDSELYGLEDNPEFETREVDERF